jgi:hypothetical protein
VSFSPRSYGHAVCIRKIDGKVFVKDNYAGREHNHYELIDYRELIKNNVFS